MKIPTRCFAFGSAHCLCDNSTEISKRRNWKPLIVLVAKVAPLQRWIILSILTTITLAAVVSYRLLPRRGDRSVYNFFMHTFIRTVKLNGRALL